MGRHIQLISIGGVIGTGLFSALAYSVAVQSSDVLLQSGLDEQSPMLVLFHAFYRKI